MGHRIEWDPLAFRITNCQEANQYLSREYCKGIRSRIFFERILWHGVLEMLQCRDAFEAQFGRSPLKSGNGDGVIEQIVQPAQVSGLRLMTKLVRINRRS